MANGYILWEGPSALDGKPIVVIATTGKTRNEKTGDMIQTWILRQNVAPHVAIKTGEDSSICGNCPHRGRNGKGRSCYVTVHQAPLSIWKTYQSGGYARFDWRIDGDKIAGRVVRFGAYGDPMAAPANVWIALAGLAKGWTGYTHQWRNPHLAAEALLMRKYVMASCDDPESYAVAQAMGWRTFRTLAEGENVQGYERICPNEANGRQCAFCLRCNGMGRGKPGASIAIHVHGSGIKNYSANCRA